MPSPPTRAGADAEQTIDNFNHEFLKSSTRLPHLEDLWLRPGRDTFYI